MKKLIVQKWFFLVAAILCAAASVTAIVTQFSYWEYCTVFALMGITLAIAFFIFTHKKLITTEVILDNIIIRIQPVFICGQTSTENEELKKLYKKFEVAVSSFGVLLGSKIIKWGQDGGLDDRLKAVEIGQDYISIDYDSRAETKNLRLLYSRPDEDELAGIAEKFWHDTGVIPVIKD